MVKAAIPGSSFIRLASTSAFAGLWVVLPGQYLKWVETLNTDYDMRIHNWKQQDKKGRKPRLCYS